MSRIANKSYHILQKVPGKIIRAVQSFLGLGLKSSSTKQDPLAAYRPNPGTYSSSSLSMGTAPTVPKPGIGRSRSLEVDRSSIESRHQQRRRAVSENNLNDLKGHVQERSGVPVGGALYRRGVDLYTQSGYNPARWNSAPTLSSMGQRDHPVATANRAFIW